MFSFECVDLGELKRLRIGHDNSGLASGWLLQVLFSFFLSFLETKSDLLISSKNIAS